MQRNPPLSLVRTATIALTVIMSFGAGSIAQRIAAAEATSAGLEFFEKQVRPLLVKHCQECHSAKEANGGLALDSRDGVQKGGDSGPVLVAGKPDASRLIEAVRYKNTDLQMPPQSRLSATEIAVLEKWVTLGAPDPRSAAPAAAGTPHVVGMSLAEGREFWSFRQPGRPVVPKVGRTDWVQTPLDAFLLARLEQAKLEPAPPADKRTLLRRATYDLTGLPPTPAEVEAFLADDLPDAFDRVVERLLNSPDYGVRWGRHWLDVARYADSNGLDENLAYGNAWRYRDYVVDAFRRDKPFDRFLIEQLAGDLLPDADVQTKTATAFLTLGAKVLAEPDREKLEMDVIDEQLDTLGKAFLGMTFGCVRCHDHKFDPLLQTDYYGLAAIFRSTKTLGDSKTGSIKHWFEFDLATSEQREAMKQVDAEIAAKKKAAADVKSKAIAKLRADARAKAADYLAAATRFAPDMPLTQVETIAAPLGLHSHILHHCRLHLEYHRDDPVFRPWHEMNAAGDANGTAEHYRRLFAEVETARAAAKKADPKSTKLGDERLEAARAALDDAEGFLAVPAKVEFALDAETLAEYDRLAEAARIAESGAPDLPAAMGVTDGKVHPEMPLHIRGNHRNPGKSVARNFPAVMRFGEAPPQFPAQASGRLEFARWLADPRHPLTARVYVNRLWRWHFGTGLVASTENFGKLGDRPSHPELLDWLAQYFIESGWSTKAVHRLILRSSAYQTASSHPAQASLNAVDPENRLLAKSPIQRLDAEEIRDAVLAVSGRLDRTLGGKTVPLRNRQFVFDHTSKDRTKYDGLRRAIYLPVVRNNLYTLFEQFDFPDPTMPTGSRNSTVVAPQALLMMNSDLVIDSAEAWAQSLLRTTSEGDARIRTAYAAAYARLPTETEIHRARDFLRSEAAQELRAAQSAAANAAARSDDRRTTAEGNAWSLFCQSLMAANEFIYLR